MSDRSDPGALLTLYFSPGACSRVSLIALEEAGATYRAQPVVLARGEHSTAEFRSLNPKGRVPVLVTGEGVLTETVAILAWLAQRFPAAALLPASDPWAQAQALSLLSWCASGLHPLIFRARMPQRVCDLPDAAGRVQALACAELAAQLQVAEDRLECGPWLAGARWSVADAYLFWAWGRACDAGIAPEAFPRLREHAGRMALRPSVQRALLREATPD
ncbi:glutathione S-transferase family protein [Caldimonas tepidiphila]|uniref:glutathione S-transferase family protein n=1 Tax=Caldimonas tepidiphila TaxID=2315841 RepID=UPI000E5A7829|nr:glutathione S-transferase family protein [Caldimonas tepidiphila]